MSLFSAPHLAAVAGASTLPTASTSTPEEHAARSTAHLKQELEQLSVPELEALLSDDQHLQKWMTSWLASLPAAKALHDVHASNLELARGNIAQQAALDEARNHVAIVKSSEYASAKAVFDELLQAQRAVCERLAPAVLLGKLHAAANEAEEVAAASHESFLKGGLQPEAFTEQYSKQRTAFHILALKREASRFAQF